MKTILVTGGAGFIGSAVIRHLVRFTELNVINVDKLTYAGNLESLNSVSQDERYHFEKVDICNSDEIERILHLYEPDLIMHLAAESHVDRSIDDPGQFIYTNIIGTYNLLEKSLQYWKKLKKNKKEGFRFHHISTDEVYGDLPHPDNRIKNQEDSTYENLALFTETTSYSPSSPYSASKASSDHLVRAWNRTYGLPTIVTNCSNNYGPFHFPEKLIPLVILNALQGKTIPVYGNGNQIRDWLYVEDHASALVLIATSGKVNETYNIGGNNEKRNIDVVKIICSLLEEMTSTRPEGVDYYEDLISFVSDRAGHDLRYAIDSTKIRNDLNWVPVETFESGIRKTVQWYLDNQDWCKRVQDGSYKGEKY